MTTPGSGGSLFHNASTPLLPDSYRDRRTPASEDDDDDQTSSAEEGDERGERLSMIVYGAASNHDQQQALQTHMQQHQQILQAKAQGQGMPQSQNINGLGRSGSTSASGAVNDIVGRTVGAVRAGAQNVSQDAAVIDRNQN